MKANPFTYAFRGCVVLAVAVLVNAGSMIVRADDAKTDEKKEEKKKKWESTATLGVTLTRGNSKNFLASGILTTKRTWEHDEVLAGASGGYGDNTITDSTGTETNTITDSYVRGFGQWNHLFTPRIYAGLRVTGEHDDVAALTYRFTVSRSEERRVGKECRTEEW